MCVCATYYPATIEVTLEKSVRAALKRNVDIATEQPPPSGLVTDCCAQTMRDFDQEMAGYFCHLVTLLVWENIDH